MGKHTEYNEDLHNSVVNAVNNHGITKAKAARQFGVSKQLVCAWIKIKAHRGTLETKPRSSKYNLLSNDSIKYVRCPKNKREDPW